MGIKVRVRWGERAIAGRGENGRDRESGREGRLASAPPGCTRIVCAAGPAAAHVATRGRAPWAGPRRGGGPATQATEATRKKVADAVGAVSRLCLGGRGGGRQVGYTVNSAVIVTKGEADEDGKPTFDMFWKCSTDESLVEWQVVACAMKDKYSVLDERYNYEFRTSNTPSARRTRASSSGRSARGARGAAVREIT